MADRAFPLIVAHRGASVAAPENTLEAFEVAARLGADWVELDVRSTADGILVCHHDPTTESGVPVVSVGIDDLDPRIPSLAQALECCFDLGLGVNVEIKCLPGEPDEAEARAVTAATVALLSSDPFVEHLAEQVLVSSFDPRTIDAVRAVSTAPTGQLVLQTDPEIVERTAANGHAALNPWDATTDEQAVATAHLLGLTVNVWTVDDPDRVRELAAWGVDAIITNVPDVARAALAP